MNIVIAEKYKWDSQTAALILATLTLFFILVVFPILTLITKP
jgi:phage shock protein PspC (stress-responsive transcriptional regulator)